MRELDPRYCQTTSGSWICCRPVGCSEFHEKNAWQSVRVVATRAGAEGGMQRDSLKGAICGRRDDTRSVNSRKRTKVCFGAKLSSISNTFVAP